MQRMIMTDSVTERRDALEELEPLQRADFLGLFQAMDGLPVIIRLVDPPLHEFLPTFEELTKRITDGKIRISAAGSLDEVDAILGRLRNDEDLLRRVKRCTSRTRCSDCAGSGWRSATQRSCRCRLGRSSTRRATRPRRRGSQARGHGASDQ